MIWLSGMPNMMNFDMTFGKSTTPVVLDTYVPIGGQGVGPEALPGGFFHRVPVEVIGNAVAEVEDDAAAARGHHVREQNWPLSSRMPFMPGAYTCVTMSPRLSSGRMARSGE